MLFSTDMSQLALVSPAAGAFASEHTLTDLADGRYDLGDGDYVNVMTYTSKTRAEGCYEAHRVYADIQCVLEGAEVLEVAPLEGLSVTSPYAEGADCELYDGAPRGERFLMAPGRFGLVVAVDAHMPGVAPDGVPARVRKAVFKIRLDHLA